MRRKRVTPEELAYGLVLLASREVDPIGDVDEDVDQARILEELGYLRILAIDFTVAQLHGRNRPKVKQAVLDSFYAGLFEAKNGPASTQFQTKLPIRLLEYAKAINTPHPNGRGWMVGKTFAQLCGAEGHLLLVMRGCDEFLVTWKELTKTLVRFDVILQDNDPGRT